MILNINQDFISEAVEDQTTKSSPLQWFYQIYI